MLAGQISGVEGYVESAAVGLMTGVHMSRLLKGMPLKAFPATTAMGALAHYVSHEGHKELQPTNVNYGIFPPLDTQKKTKKSDRRRLHAIRSLRDLGAFAASIDENIEVEYLNQQLDSLTAQPV